MQTRWMLQRAPMQDDGASDPSLTQGALKIHALARRARAAETHAARGDIYGELIATCARCHEARREEALAQ